MHVFTFLKKCWTFDGISFNLTGVPWKEMIKEDSSEIWMYFYPLLLEQLMEKDNKLAGFVASRLKSFKWVWLELNTVKVQKTRCWRRKSQ